MFLETSLKSKHADCDVRLGVHLAQCRLAQCCDLCENVQRQQQQQASSTTTTTSTTGPSSSFPFELVLLVDVSSVHLPQ